MDQLSANRSRFGFAVAGLDVDLRVAGFAGTEGISQLFQVELNLVSESVDIPFDAVVGMRAALTIQAREGPRYINGTVGRFELGGQRGRFTSYRATLVPFLWFFGHRHGSRIFQDLSVDQIVAKILSEAGVPADDYCFVLKGRHPVRDYCVQYRESELDFMCRLLEEEGIFYYFEHLPDRHTLVMSDSSVVHEGIQEPRTLPFRAETNTWADEEYVRTLSYAEEVKPGRVTLRCFDFRKPNLELEVSASAKTGDQQLALEVYDFPGEYDKEAVGDFLARVRLQEHRSPGIRTSGESDCPRLIPGYLFGLEHHPRDEINRNYLLTLVEHSAEQPQVLEEQAGPGQSKYSNRFEALPTDTPYRPPRATRRPVVEGSQTAFVVGPPGEEIYVDRYGRVKVQFHWDREGQRNEKSSCWIRVSQTIAGAGWGSMFIPRIGQEVIVDFLEGDPDRPIITGRVYNGLSLPPFTLPEQGVVSGIKSDTVKGNGYNEISFNDTAGKEHFNVHAQYDATTAVGHDRNETVGNDQSVKVANNRVDSVGVDASESIGSNMSLSVGSNKKETVGGNSSLSIGGNNSVSVGGNKTETISVACAETIGAAKALTVGAAYQISVGAAMNATVGLASFEQVGLNKHILAGNKIVLECGAGKITIASSGKITIEGTEIAIKASGPVDIDGSVVDLN